MRSLACCHRNKEISLDFDEHDRVRTYTGLEGCMLNGCTFDNESAASNGCTTTESLDEDVSSCSSSKDPLSSSFSSQCLLNKRQEDEHGLDEWEATSSSHHLLAKEKVPVYTMCFSDIETMKEKFAKLLLGEDVSGGCRGTTTALALSHAITNLAASVFGELWKLEPLSEEKKSRWRREMDWFLSPTNYMVELVPAKQSGANGRMLEIMTPKARSDVNMNLPALQKLDSMLIDVLDSMVDIEFWYAEGGSRAEARSRRDGIRQTKKWWLPSPRVPESGLSPLQRKKLGFQGKLVHQVLKAANSINEHLLLQMPVPSIISDALPKSGKASLGENSYRAITLEHKSVEDMLHSLYLKSEHSVLEVVNQLEGACIVWKQKISDGVARRSPIRNSWAFVRDFGSELDRIEMLLQRAEALLRLLKSRFPNLPQTFLDVTKVQYNKDVGLSIIEAYSRALGNLAFSILSRIGDILQEDDLHKPSTPVATLKFDFSSDVYLAGITETPPGHIRRTLVDQMNMIDGRPCDSNANKGSEEKFLYNKARLITMAAFSPNRNRHWCYGREA